MVFSQNKVNRIREIPILQSCPTFRDHASCFLVRSQAQKKPWKRCVFLYLLSKVCSSPMTHFHLLFMAVCCSKCVLLSSSSCLTLALEENTGRNAAGGREEEEGSNRDRGRGPLFRNSAGLEYLCCTISVHHWCQHSVGSRVSATPPPHQFQLYSQLDLNPKWKR